MRAGAILVAITALSIAACAADKSPPQAIPKPPPKASTGGPCGDGTVLQPNERCP